MKTGKLPTAARALAVSIALCGAGSASADILANGNSGPNWLPSPGIYSFSFTNTTGYTSGQITFDLLGNLSLDGWNYPWIADIFTLSVNAMPVFAGAFNMGGGGTSWALGPNGMSWKTFTGGCGYSCTATTWQGGSTQVSLPISLLAGASYDVQFGYIGAPQTLSDEGWKVGSYTVTAVPEPETYAMVLAGLGLVGVMARRRRGKG